MAEKEPTTKDELMKAKDGIDEKIQGHLDTIKKLKGRKKEVVKTMRGMKPADGLPAKTFIGIPIPSLKTVTITAIVLSLIVAVFGYVWPAISNETSPEEIEV